jgi:hypothetical protein
LRRLFRLTVILFVAGACMVFAAALAGGLMDDRAFTPQAVGAVH